MPELTLFLTRLILSWKAFTFQGRVFYQVNGVFMGISAATDLCNLVLGLSEVWGKRHLPGHTIAYCRYVDDVCSIIWTQSNVAPEFVVDVNVWGYAAQMQEIGQQRKFLDYHLTLKKTGEKWGLVTEHRFKEGKKPTWPIFASPHPRNVRVGLFTAMFTRILWRSSDLEAAGHLWNLFEVG